MLVGVNFDLWWNGYDLVLLAEAWFEDLVVFEVEAVTYLFDTLFELVIWTSEYIIEIAELWLLGRLYKDMSYAKCSETFIVYHGHQGHS